MGNTEVIAKSYPVTCPACKGKNMAVYRGSVFHKHDSENETTLERQFAPFLHGRTATECQYVCCHECANSNVGSEIKKRMTLKPYGWKEAFEVPMSYEPIKD